LEKAMQPGTDREVRKSAIAAVAVMADRFATHGDALRSPELLDELIKSSRDEDPLIRQTSAFALGLLPEPGAAARLDIMLEDSDPDTRVDAAVGLARHGDTRGGSVFKEVLERASRAGEPATDSELELFLALKNSILAIERVAKSLSADERREFAALLAPISRNYREPTIRIAAKSALNALHEAR